MAAGRSETDETRVSLLLIDFAMYILRRPLAWLESAASSPTGTALLLQVAHGSDLHGRRSSLPARIVLLDTALKWLWT